jgi:hypothetical protein
MPPWLPFKIGYLTVALVCLIQWGKPSPWLRVDFFSGGCLLMRALPVLRSMLNRSSARSSSECQRERWGSTAAPGWVSWALALTVADLAVYLDYGHWHLVPSLERPSAQAFGLLLYLAVALWMRWTQRYLGTAFADQSLRPTLIVERNQQCGGKESAAFISACESSEQKEHRYQKEENDREMNHERM